MYKCYMMEWSCCVCCRLALDVVVPLAVDLKACANYEAGAAIAEKLDVPSCLILAGKDRMTPLKAGKALGTAMKAQITVLPEFGHMLPVEAPKQSLVALRNFISSL